MDYRVISLNSTINRARMSGIKKVPRKSVKQAAASTAASERTDYVLSEWEVMSLEDTGCFVIRDTRSADKAQLHYTQVMTAEGQPLDDPRQAVGGVIKVLRYTDHVQYFLAESSRTQTFEEKLGVVEKVEGGSLHMWVWSTDERLVIPHGLLEQEYQHIEPSTLFNSVIRIKFLAHGPHSATLVEYRPQPSQTDAQQGQLSQPQQDIRQAQQDLSRAVDEGVYKEAGPALERWKEISLWLVSYVESVTQKNVGVADVSYMQTINGLFDDLNDPSTSEHSNRLRQCQAFIEEAGKKKAIEDQLAPGGAKVEQSTLSQPGLPPRSSPYQQAIQHAVKSHSMPVQPSHYDHLAEDGHCNKCRLRCKLVPFCTHQLCCNCITDSVMQQACCVCSDPKKFVGQLEFLEKSLGGKCDGCHTVKLRVDYCTHKVCKHCILSSKGLTTCYICDDELNQDYRRAMLDYVRFDCAAKCGKVKSGLEVISFDCRCVVCVDCLVANISAPDCFVCRAQRSKSDRNQLADYQR
jgi:hypothetical protein